MAEYLEDYFARLYCMDKELDVEHCSVIFSQENGNIGIIYRKKEEPPTYENLSMIDAFNLISKYILKNSKLIF